MGPFLHINSNLIFLTWIAEMRLFDVHAHLYALWYAALLISLHGVRASVCALYSYLCSILCACGVNAISSMLKSTHSPQNKKFRTCLAFATSQRRVVRQISKLRPQTMHSHAYTCSFNLLQKYGARRR